jgi:hypothetical protein
LLRCILVCSAPVAAEQSARGTRSSHSFGCVRDRRAIREAGASTKPAAGLPYVDLLLVPPVKLVVVCAPVNEEVPIQVRRRFTCKSAFFRVAGPGFEPGTP